MLAEPMRHEALIQRHEQLVVTDWRQKAEERIEELGPKARNVSVRVSSELTSAGLHHLVDGSLRDAGTFSHTNTLEYTINMHQLHWVCAEIIRSLIP